MSQVVDLTFLTEDEEEAFRKMLNEELQLQQSEEIRLKSVSDKRSIMYCMYSTFSCPGNYAKRSITIPKDSHLKMLSRFAVDAVSVLA